jgi:hypothetical protein
MKGKQPSLRWLLAVCVALALGALVLAGCGGSSGTSSSSTAETSTTASAAGTEGGTTESGSAESSGSEGGPGGPGMTDISTEARACLKEKGAEMPGFKGGPGGEGGAPNMNSTAFKKQVKEYVACVRENGYELAEPNFSGEIPVFAQEESESAAFKKASAQCQGLLCGPPASSGESGTET